MLARSGFFAVCSGGPGKTFGGARSRSGAPMRTRAWLLLPAVVVCGALAWRKLRYRPLPQLVGWLASSPTPPVIPSPPEASALVFAAARVLEGLRLARNTCLLRALLLAWLLREAGAVELHLGVKRLANAAVGHAWITLGGEEVGPEGAEGCTAMVVLPVSGLAAEGR